MAVQFGGSTKDANEWRRLPEPVGFGCIAFYEIGNLARPQKLQDVAPLLQGGMNAGPFLRNPSRQVCSCDFDEFRPATNRLRRRPVMGQICFIDARVFVCKLRCTHHG